MRSQSCPSAAARGNAVPGQGRARCHCHCHLLPARDPLPRQVEQRSAHHGHGCAGARPGPPHTYSARNTPVTPIQTHPHAPSTLRCVHTPAQNGYNNTRSHTQPRAAGQSHSPRGLYGPQAQGSSATLTARCPPRPVPLTWAGQRRAGSRRLSGGRAGGAAAPPSYGAGRDRTGRHRRCSPRVIPAPAHLRLEIPSGKEAGAP